MIQESTIRINKIDYGVSYYLVTGWKNQNKTLIDPKECRPST